MKSAHQFLPTPSRHHGCKCAVGHNIRQFSKHQRQGVCHADHRYRDAVVDDAFDAVRDSGNRLLQTQGEVEVATHQFQKRDPVRMDRENRDWLRDEHGFVAHRPLPASGCGSAPHLAWYVARGPFDHRLSQTSRRIFPETRGIVLDARSRRSGEIPSTNFARSSEYRHSSTRVAASPTTKAASPITIPPITSNQRGPDGEPVTVRPLAGSPRLAHVRGVAARNSIFSICLVRRVGGVSCVQYPRRRLLSTEKSSARLCRALHDCAEYFSGTSAKGFSRRKQPRIWRSIPTNLCALRATSYPVTARLRQNQSHSSHTSRLTISCRLS